MAFNTKSIIKDINEKPIPQLYNPTTDSYEVVQGANGASRVIAYDVNGNPIDLTTLFGNIVTTLNQKNLPNGASTLMKQDDTITAINNVITELGKKSLAVGASTSAKQDAMITSLANVTLEIAKPVKLNGSTMEYFGKTGDVKPTVGLVKGATYFEIDSTGNKNSKVFMYDGTTWVVI